MTDDHSNAPRKPQTRPPLSRERVLHAAIAIADEGGLESLTMRRLGGRLGVEAMSLYKHVAGKEAVLDGIIDLVFGEIELPAAGADWRTAMSRRALSARRVLGSHPWAIGMMESRAAMGPATLRYVDAVMASLRAGGFSLQMTAQAFVLLDSYIYGFVVQEMSYSARQPDEQAEALDEPPPGADHVFAHLAEMAAEYRHGYSYDDEFEFGLDLILDALETYVTSG